MDPAISTNDGFRKVVGLLAGLSSFEVQLLRQILAAAETAPPATIQLDVSDLSARELEVMNAMIEQKSNKAIALQMGISPRTVEKYRSNVLGKLGYRSTLALIGALAHGGSIRS